jgi:hypothetical protein
MLLRTGGDPVHGLQDAEEPPSDLIKDRDICTIRVIFERQFSDRQPVRAFIALL